MVSSTATPFAVVKTAGEDLVLRVCGSTHHGQVVRLKSAKCTIGSGPRCTLRLRARGVRPIHCLIVRGSAGTVIRRWSPDTRLNGRAFTDAELVDGDRLSIGMIELEVLDPGRLASLEAAEGREVPLQQPPRPQVSGPGPSDPRRSDRLAARLALANCQGRQRVRRVLEKLRSANREITRLGQLQDEGSRRERQLNERAEALSTRGGDLDLRREALERERREWNAKLAETVERLRQRGEQLDADRAELEAQREDLQRRRQQWEGEQTAIASPQEQEDPPADSELPPQDEPQEAPIEEPIDMSDVFRRMGFGGLPPEEKPRPETSGEPEPQPSETAATDRPPRGPRAEEGGGEESIEDYMSRLMDRVQTIRGTAEREGYPSKESRPAESPRRQPVEPKLDPESPKLEEPSVPQRVAPPRQPAEMAPRAVAPENRSSLSALRELANLSAHSAIDRHARRQARLASWGKLLIAAVGIVIGTVLLWIWWTTPAGTATFCAAMVSFVVTLFWGIQWIALAGGKGQVRAGRQEAGAGRDLKGKQRRRARRGQEAPCGGESDPPLFDSADRELEHELKAMIDAWPRQ